MLVPALYLALEKKAKKKGKEAKGGLRCKGTPDAVSGDTEVLSSHEGDEDEQDEEEEDEDKPLVGGTYSLECLPRNELSPFGVPLVRTIGIRVRSILFLPTEFGLI